MAACGFISGTTPWIKLLTRPTGAIRHGGAEMEVGDGAQAGAGTA